MAGEKEIRTKIASVKNTRKITKAMEMVAASKMRRAQERMRAARPYASEIVRVIQHVAHASLEYRHEWLNEREKCKAVGFIVVSTDRGLCGGLNINMLKAAAAEMKKWSDQGVEVKVAAFGNKGASFFKRHGGLMAQTSGLGDSPGMEDLLGTIKVMLDAYDDGQIDRLFLVENHFVNTMTQRAEVRTLIPVVPETDERLKHRWDYIYEPDAKEILGELLRRYVEMQVWRAVTENVACEMVARMIAMKSASDNANQFIDELQLLYNKLRQAAITQEISEIVGGAAAV